MKHHEPKGHTYKELKTNREEMLVSEGPWKDWILYRHPDGQWVSLIKLEPEFAQRFREKLQRVESMKEVELHFKNPQDLNDAIETTPNKKGLSTGLP